MSQQPKQFKDAGLYGMLDCDGGQGMRGLSWMHDGPYGRRGMELELPEERNLDKKCV